MRRLLLIISVLLLSACSTFSGTTGQFVTSETVSVSGQTSGFTDRVIAIGKRMGYQYSGGNRGQNLVRLTDQPNFGQTMLGRAFSVQMTVALQGDGRTIAIEFTSVGGSSDGEKNSERRLRELKAALQSEFGR